MVSTGSTMASLFSHFSPEIITGGPKPIPMRVHIVDGFSLNMDKCEVMKSAKVESSRGRIGGRRCVVSLAFRSPTFLATCV